MAEQAKKRKRIVKNPETFRERAMKATDSSSKPKVTHKARKGLVKALSKVFGPIGKALKFVFNRQPFKFFGKPMRFIGKVLFPVYIRNSWQELKLVTWPAFGLSLRLTFAVLVFALAFGIAIAGLDYVLDKVFREVLLK